MVPKTIQKVIQFCKWQFLHFFLSNYETFFNFVFKSIFFLKLISLRVHDKLVRIFIRKSVSPNVKGRPVANVEEREQERKDDQKDQVRPAIIVRRRLPDLPVSAGRRVFVAAALELHLAGVPLPVTADFRFRRLVRLLHQRDGGHHFRCLDSGT